MESEVRNVPTHVGFIMDGNGRWAKGRNKTRIYGHQKGADVIEEVVETCYSSGVKVVSLYAFSTENWSRPKDEVDAIFNLLRKFLKRYSNRLIEEKIGLRISGDVKMIPEALRTQCEKSVRDSAGFKDHILNIAINYGSRAEIVKAVNELISEGKKEVTQEDISSHLYTKDIPDIDMVVRTSGEYRLSNFFMWQCAYSEIYVTDVMWPDFHKDEVLKALDWFSSRKRRFGGI